MSRYIKTSMTAHAVSTLPGSSPTPVPLRAVLTWDKEDPLAVCLEFGSSEENKKTWLLARSMVYDVVAGPVGVPVGKGEIRLLATAKTIDVTWPDRNPMTVLHLSRAKTATWLNQTLRTMGDLEAGMSYDWGRVAERLIDGA